MHFTIKQAFPFRSDAREQILEKLIIIELAGELNEDFRNPGMVDFLAGRSRIRSSFGTLI